MGLHSVIKGLLLVTVLVMAAVPRAIADMIVIDSNVPEIHVGTHLPDGTAPTLPPGGRVQVLLSSNQTKLFERPGGTSRSVEQPVGGVRGMRTSE